MPLPATPMLLVLLLIARASSHSTIVNPMSRQQLCSTGIAPGCYITEQEAFRVQAPRGAYNCSGTTTASTRFAALNNSTLFAPYAFPVPPGSQSVPFTWLSVDGPPSSGYDYVVITNGSSPTVLASFAMPPYSDTPREISHEVPLAGLTGSQTILARSNISGSDMATYACVDLYIDSMEVRNSTM